MPSSSTAQCAWRSGSRDPCSRSADGRSKLCIVHSPDSKSDVEFLAALNAELDNPTTINLNGWVFPLTADLVTIFQTRRFDKPVSFKAAIFEGDMSFEATEFIEDVDFEGAQFKGEVTFSGAKFGPDKSSASAKFDKAVFKSPVSFAGAKFRSESFFRETAFENDFKMDADTEFTAASYFNGAVFKSEAIFDKAGFKDVEFDGGRFERGCAFVDTKFNGQATFEKAVFVEFADFSETKFGDLAKFGDASFQRRVTFEDARFLKADANFDRAEFLGSVSFEKAQFQGSTYFTKTNFSQDATFDRTEFHAAASFTNTIFHNVFFSSTRFGAGDAKATATFKDVQFTRGLFSDATFGGDLVFNNPQVAALTIIERAVFSGGTTFCVQVREGRLSIRDTDVSLVRFHGSMIENVDFENAGWGNPKPYRLKIADEPPDSRPLKEVEGQLEEARRLYRQLRLNYDKAGEYEIAGRFYVSESEMSYLLLPRVLRWIHPRGLYKRASNYGESVGRATVWLILIVLFFGFLYWGISQVKPVWFTAPPKMLGKEPSGKLYPQEALWLSLQASKPLADVGLYPRTFYYWIVLVEGFIVPTQLAFFLLAIRRRFRRGD